MQEKQCTHNITHINGTKYMAYDVEESRTQIKFRNVVKDVDRSDKEVEYIFPRNEIVDCSVLRQREPRKRR